MLASRSTIKQLVASGQVLAGEGWLSGYNCLSTSSGTITLYNALTATGTAVFTATPTAGATVLLPNVHFTVGCYCTIGNTATVNFFLLEQ